MKQITAMHRRGTGWWWAGGALALCSGLFFNLLPCLMVNTQPQGTSPTQPRILLTSGILCTYLLSMSHIWVIRPRSWPVKSVMVSEPILKEMSPPASHAMTFSLPSSEPPSFKLLCCFKQGDKEDPTCCSKIWDERGYSEENRTLQERHLFWVTLKHLSKFRVASTKRNYCRIKISAAQSHSSIKPYFVP